MYRRACVPVKLVLIAMRLETWNHFPTDLIVIIYFLTASFVSVTVAPDCALF